MDNHDNTSKTLTHFDERSREWDQLYSRRSQFADRLNLFVGSVESLIPSGSEVLDYGCGTGTIARELAKSGYRVTGLDGSAGMIEEARRIAAEIENVEFEHIDPPTWIPRQTYAATVCSSVIEYVADDVLLLTKLADSLVAGGYLLISVPSRESWVGRLEDLIAAKRRDTQYARRRYSQSDIREKLQQTRLEWRKSVNFELPRLGGGGVQLSRLGFLGMMKLVVAQKPQET